MLNFKFHLMKTSFLLAIFSSYGCLAQIDGSIISRSEVTFPTYEESPAIEMYYDKLTYEAAIADKEVQIDKIEYFSDGLRVVAYLSYPVNPENKVHPVIIFNRGSGVRNDISYVHAPLFKKLARSGFLVLAPALRGSEGGQGTDEIGGSEINDIMNVIPLLGQINYADTTNLFMLGESRGGIMTYLALKRKFPLKAAAVIGGITDMSYYLKDRPWAEKFFKENFPDYADKKDSILQTRSALSWTEEMEAPILIMNGQADPQVVPRHALNMAAELSGLGKEYELIIMEGGNHILSGKHTERRDQEVLRWFKKYLN